MTPAGAASAHPGYRPDIDGLRAVAVLAVMGYHAAPALVPGGFVGVDVFFVISGFLIGGQIVEALDRGAFSVPGFYFRRVRRVFPALFVVVAATLAAGVVLLSPREMKALLPSAGAALIGVSNVFFWRSTTYFAEAAELQPLLMTWSLGVEEQFYLLAPLVLALVHRLDRRLLLPAVVALCLMSLAASALLTIRQPAAAFYLLPTRVFELGLGVVLVLLPQHPVHGRPWSWMPEPRLRAPLGAALVVGSMFLLDRSHAVPGLVVLVPCLGAALLIASPGSELNRLVLARRGMVGIGLVSFSLYLWHWPLLSFARIATGGPLTPTAIAAVLVVTALLACLTYLLVEMPFRRLSSFMPGRALALALAGPAASCVVLAIVLFTSADSGATSPGFSGAQPVDRVGEPLRTDRCLVAGRALEPATAPECQPEVRPYVALIGDSHAAAIGPALRGRIGLQGLGFAQFTRSSCPPLLDGSQAFDRFPQNEGRCAAFNAAVFAHLLADPDARVVVLTAWWSGPFVDPLSEVAGRHVLQGVDAGSMPQLQRLALGVTRTVEALRQAGKIVIVIGDPPVMNFDPPSRMLTAVIPARLRLSGLLGQPDPEAAMTPARGGLPSAPAAANEALAAAFARLPPNGALSFVDPFRALCNEGHCLAAKGGTLLYSDRHHLSDAGADLVLSDAALGRALTAARVSGQ